MRRLVRWLFRLLILGIVLAAALVLLKDVLLKAVVEWRIRQHTGLSVSIRRLEAALFSPTVTAEGVKLYNPPAFGGSVLVDIPEVQAEYDPRKLIAGKVHLNLLRLRLNEIGMVKNSLGQTNLFALFSEADRPLTAALPASPPRVPQINPAPAPPAVPSPAPPRSPGTASRRLEFDGIDRLYLSLDTVLFIDQQLPSNSWVRPIGWKNYELRNIRTADDAKKWAVLLYYRIAVAQPRPLPPSRGR